jgi:hypothetical protein
MAEGWLTTIYLSYLYLIGFYKVHVSNNGRIDRCRTEQYCTAKKRECQKQWTLPGCRQDITSMVKPVGFEIGNRTARLEYEF